MSDQNHILQSRLDTLRRDHLYRSRRVVEGPQGVEIVMGGKKYLSFCSNDYLGLANHPEVVAAFRRGAELYGVGSGAAHLVSGHSAAHHALEEELAAFTGRPRALLFSTGYMANLGVMAALCGRHDVICEDRLNHASLIDAARLAGSRLVRYRHAEGAHLRECAAQHAGHVKLIASDGVFSMDGDVAPLPDMVAVAHEAEAWLMIDDAHGLGVTGPGGRGTVAERNASVGDVPILMGTLGKAFGTFGAFVAGDEALIETLIQSARAYIYTTAPPPAVAEATRAALAIAQRDEWRRDHLRTLVRRFRSGAQQLGLTLMDSATPIQPIIVGPAAEALRYSDALAETGILISAIRPPTVPQGTARLRVTFSATHSEAHVDRLLGALETFRAAPGAIST